MEFVEASSFPHCDSVSFATTFRGVALQRPSGVADDEGPALHAITVLVADDNEIIRIIASQMLADLGIYHQVVENGRLACEALAKQEFDLLLIDCHMPEMDGFEAVRQLREEERLRETEESARRLTIVALTADSTPETRERCAEAGMDGILLKPLELPKLEGALRRYLFAKSLPAASTDSRTGVDVALQPSGPPIELSQVLLRYGQSRGLVRLVFQLFCEQLRQDVGTVEQSVRDGFASQLFFTAHAIKSAATAVSAERLREQAVKLEARSRTRRFAGAHEEIVALKAEARRCVEFLATLDLGPEDESDA